MATARLLLAIAVLLSACGGSSGNVADVAQLAEAEVTQVAPPVEGRVALAAAQGEPHILWFWGAN